MDSVKLLSGEQLVKKGAIKTETTLPEKGLKDVLPNGSWLEQKQIQAAIEARRHLLEDERIEKCGVLSHAEWRDELKLAKLIDKTGGHWFYLGHNVGSQMFLYPEEALLLMELNCLELKYNGVTVSLQQAYSLLLQGRVKLLEYKVYSSLSRIGYKVLRNQLSATTSDEKQFNFSPDKGTTENNRINESETVKDVAINNLEICKEKKVVDQIDSNEDVTSTTNTVSDMSVEVPLETIHDMEVCDEKEISNKDILFSYENVTREENSQDTPSEEISRGVVTSNSKSNELDNDSRVENEGSSLLNWRDMPLQLIKNAEYLDLRNNYCENVRKLPRAVIKDKLQLEGGCWNAFTYKSSTFFKQRKSKYYLERLQKVVQRKKETTYNESLKQLESLHSNIGKGAVKISAPEETYLPRNVYLNKNEYEINLQDISSKRQNVAAVNNLRSYSIGDSEVNGEHVPRLQSSSRNDSSTRRNQRTYSTPNSYGYQRNFFNQNVYRSFLFQRSHVPFNYYQYNYSYQRPFSMYQHFNAYNFSPFNNVFGPRYHNVHQRERNNDYGGSITIDLDQGESSTTRKRRYSAHRNKYVAEQSRKLEHLDGIKKLARRVRELVKSGNTCPENFSSLERLIRSYNIRYKANVTLPESLEIINDQLDSEAIDLDEEDEGQETPKRKRYHDNHISLERTENLNALKLLASKLKDLETKKVATSVDRRAFSNLIKTFNNSYKASIYLNNSFEICDNQWVNLDSSSDSDCIIEETSSFKSKKVKNPFTVLFNHSNHSNEVNIATVASSSKENADMFEIPKYDEATVMEFKNWLPDFDDWGRTEIVSKQFTHCRLMDVNKEQFMFNYLKTYKSKLKNWLDLKIAFWETIEENTVNRENGSETINSGLDQVPSLQPLIKQEDCRNMGSILKKLSIIASCNELHSTCNFQLMFDVYERNVQNFRKSDRPQPSFRIVCLDETTNFPTSADIVTLHATQKDDVPLVCAVVGPSSVSYLQMKPTDIPVHILHSDI